MIDTVAISLVEYEQFLVSQESTTVFLEDTFNTALKVRKLHQRMIHLSDQLFYRRVALLYVKSIYFPSLYCETCFRVTELNRDEQELLINSSVPIGTIFNSRYGPENVYKACIEVTQGRYSTATSYLPTTSQLHKKKYDYIVTGRNIGRIVEYFSLDTLNIE